MKIRPSSLSFLPFLVSAFFTAASPVRAQSLEIKPVWIAGKTYIQSTELLQKGSVPMGGQTMEQETRMSLETSTSVRPAIPGKILSVRQNHISFRMNMAGQELSFDSAKPGQDPLGIGEFFKRFASKPLEVQLDARDEPVKLLNPGEFTTSEAQPGNPAAELFKPDNLLDSVRQGSLRTPPSGPVQPGDSWDWSYSQNIPMAGTLKAAGKYTFKALTEKNGFRCAEIAMEGTLTSTPPTNAPASPEAELMKAMGL